MRLSLDFQPRPIIGDYSKNGSSTEGVLDLDGNRQADLVILDGQESLSEPIVDLLGLQQLALTTGKKLFTEAELKESGLAPKLVKRQQTESGIESTYTETSLADLQGGRSMLKAALSEEAEFNLEARGYQPTGPMEFVIDPFQSTLFLSRQVDSVE